MAEAPPFQRLDKWLWCARVLRGREDCARLVAAGAVRLNRQPTDKPYARLRPGDVVTIAVHGDVRVVEVLALALRRGPAREAAALYRLIADPCSTPASGAGGLPCGEGETGSYRSAV